jgi:hypothetical protein
LREIVGLSRSQITIFKLKKILVSVRVNLGMMCDYGASESKMCFFWVEVEMELRSFAGEG